MAAPPEVTHLDACAAPGAQRLFVLRDDERARATLPFAFRYWATDLAANSPVNVTSNGWISLSTDTLSTRSGSLPNPAAPNAVLAPYWRDIQIRGDGVCVATLGTAPARRFVVEWRNALDVNNASTQLTFEVVLHEGTHLIDLSYQAMTNAASATVGLENPSGSEAISGCLGSTTPWCRPPAGTRLRFAPIP